MSEPDLMDRNLDVKCAIETIAVSEATFFDSEKISWLPELDFWDLFPRILFVIIDPQPDGVRGLWRWEVEVNEGWWLSWNHETMEFDFHEGNVPVGDESLRRRIEDAADNAADSGLRDDVLTKGLKDFEIRSVFAVRR